MKPQYWPPTEARRGLVDVLWHWRNESMLLALIATVSAALVWALNLQATILIVATVAEVAWAVRPIRRKLLARLWWLVTPHRVRAGCAQARLQSHEGRLPVVLRTKLTPRGEQLLLWCRAGTSADDLEAARPLLRAACLATDVQVRRNVRHARLVTVEVIRR